MTRVLFPSFSRGEIGPELWGRVDLPILRTGLATSLNTIHHEAGAVSNRPGLEWVGPCMQSSGTPSRLIAFWYSTTDTYELEFGHMAIRVIRDTGFVLRAPIAVTAATQTNPVTVTAPGHGFSAGADVYVVDVGGMTELNQRWFKVSNPVGDVFDLADQQSGEAIDGTSYGAYTSGGTVAEVYEIPSPYDIEHVLDIQRAQSGNVMTLTHPLYEQRELTRIDHDDWTLEVIPFEPLQTEPVNLAITGTAGSVTDKYKVTAINEETAEESLAGLAPPVPVASATATNPVVVTATGHGYSDFDEVKLTGFSEMVEVNDRRFTIIGVTTDTFELDGEDGTGYAPETTGGQSYRTHVQIDAGADPPSNTITWDKLTGIRYYSIYRYDNGVWGYLGNSEVPEFTDDNIEPDLSLTPPRARNPFLGEGNYPAAVGFYEQRRVFGGSRNAPDTKNYSVPGSFGNMSQSSPRRPDDAIQATLSSDRVDEIRGFAPGTDLLVFTAGAEWRVNSGGEGAFSAETLRQLPQTRHGSSKRPPLMIGDQVFFLTPDDRSVRSIGFSLEKDSYSGLDLMLLAPHLFKTRTVVDWDAATILAPHVFAVRSDGLVAVLTFELSEDVRAWCRWSTLGDFLRVSAVQPIDIRQDMKPYFVVRRTINGRQVHYIERLASRRFETVQDAFFVDSGLSYDDPKVITGASQADPVVVDCAGHGFTIADEIDIYDIRWQPTFDAVFNVIEADQLNGRRYFPADITTDSFALVTDQGRADIGGVTQANPAVVTTLVAHSYLPGDKVGVFGVAGMTELNGKTYTVGAVTETTYELQGVDSTLFTPYISQGQSYFTEDGTEFSAYLSGGTARRAVDEVGGLWHLEGAPVVALAGGNVVSNLVVQDGKVSFARKFSRIHSGLRMISDVEPLDFEAPQGTIQGRRQHIPTVTLRAVNTRGIWMGRDPYHLSEFKQRSSEKMGEPTQLLTGDREFPIQATWSASSRTYIRQIDPLPFTITMLVPDLTVGR